MNVILYWFDQLRLGGERLPMSTPAFGCVTIAKGCVLRALAVVAPPPTGNQASNGGAGKISSAEIRAMMNPDMIWPAATLVAAREAMKSRVLRNMM